MCYMVFAEAKYTVMIDTIKSTSRGTIVKYNWGKRTLFILCFSDFTRVYMHVLLN